MIPVGKVRLAVEADAAALLAIYAPYVAETAITFEITVPTLEQYLTRVRETLSVAPWLVYQIGETIVGFAHGGRHRTREAYAWSADVSVYVMRDYQRHGIARHLYSRLLPALGEQGYHNAFAGIALPNVGSVTLHESMGFEPVSVYRSVGYKLGRWHDVGWWQKRLREPSLNPAPLRNPAEVVVLR